MRKALFVVLGFFALSAQAPADPIMTNYRAYRAALQSGDLAAAETAAQAAWEAARAREPTVARTGALALNYAKIALANGHREAASQPAQQAAAMANGGQAGLDPILTRLVVGRTRLVSGAREEEVGELLTALNDAQSHQDIGADAFEAATDLGQWALNERHFQLAAASYEKAAALADFAPTNHDLARGQTRTAQGVALILSATTTETDEWGRGLGATGSNLRVADQHDIYAQAQAVLVQAEEALFPLAAARPTDVSLTPAQQNYGLAHAWRTVINARLFSNDQARLEEPAVRLRMRLAGSGPLCPFRVITEPDPRYPPGAADHGQFGAVVTRILVDPDGSIRDARVVTAIPERFGPAVARVASRWRVERTADAPADCQMQPVVFQTYSFRID